MAILLLKQRIDAILAIADQAIVIENGRKLETAAGVKLRNTPETLRRHLGV